MTTKKNKTYALISNNKRWDYQTDYTHLHIDGILQGTIITKDILQKLKTNDTLAIENIISLGSSLSEIVETLKLIAQYNANLYLAQENMFFKADKLPEIASSLLIALRLHQSLISLRSKNALQERKAQGLKLGRPHGLNPALKLDENKEEIKRLLLSGVSKDKIANHFNVCRATVYNFIRKNPELLSGEIM